MSDSEPTLRPRPDPTWRAIACGGFHCVALRDDGRVVTWGDRRRGQRRDAPTDAAGPYVAIACGRSHSVALRDDGRVVVWGSDEHDERADAPTDAGPYVGIACGFHHSLALRHDGHVITFGGNSLYQRRDSPTDAGYTWRSRVGFFTASRFAPTAAS
mmetsp:Transcript_26657/g.106789  ORF Transcript_26657/g.106789 Transcript_26657/m.106789 type:complete len:157 (+) Transcript_26657:135-605(+)